ncbi:MAG: hypothetical protein WC966_07550 [Bradymonadales bacterium]|jgi:hypothetical protein
MRVTKINEGIKTMKSYGRLHAVAVLSVLAMVMMFLGSCTEEREIRLEGMRAFSMVVQPINGFGTKENPLKFATHFSSQGQCPAGATCHDVVIGAYAVDNFGNEYTDFNGKVKVKAIPGEVNITELEVRNGKIGTWSKDADGKLTLVSGVTISLRYNVGITKIWIEDSLDSFELYGEEVRQRPTLSTAVSQAFYFEPLTIEMLQYNPVYLAGPSPLLGQYANIEGREGHNIVVTNVVATGFYVTDLDATQYDSLFIFTFSQPARVEIGDRVCELQGGIAEFTGMTQLQFPSWGIQNKERSTAEDQDPAPEDGEDGAGTCRDKVTGKSRPCTPEEIELMAEIVDCSGNYRGGPITDKEERKAFGKLPLPEPKVITPAMLTQENRDVLEKIESSVVTIENLRLSSTFIDCDDNGNGKIESGSAEAECRSTCTDDLTCTELSNLRSYDQWRAWTVEGNAEISVASSSLITGFNILNGCEVGQVFQAGVYRQTYKCEERYLKRITGNLKQVLPGCSGTRLCDGLTQKFGLIVIEPRFATDLIARD